MAKFLNRFQVTDELHQIINESRDYLILISPYFKLNNLIKSALKKHAFDKSFELIVVYGKNEDNKASSLSDSDLDFFKSFQNVEIRYHRKLHAKIYANEEKCLLTSMNLHDYSMNENIEFGILTKSKSLDTLAAIVNFVPGSLDKDAFDFCEYIIEKSDLQFKKEVKKEKSFFGLFTKKGEANIEVEIQRYGYCLRNGVKIPFNIQKPYSIEAFQSWNQYQNPNYMERYCHQCGKPAKTSMKNPICKDCL